VIAWLQVNAKQTRWLKGKINTKIVLSFTELVQVFR